jgi:2-hydroxy-6-oxonona-2,4-dienedioate hydrolase
LWGKQDRLFLFCNAIYFAKNIKNSKLVILDKCGHFPNIEKAEEFNKIVNEFLLE